MEKIECKHLKAVVHDGDRLLFSTCPECGEHPYVSDVINNLLEELRGGLAEVKAAMLGIPED